MLNFPKRDIVAHQEFLQEVKRAHRFYARFYFLKKDYSLIKSLPKNSRVLDIGCGDGKYFCRSMLMRDDLYLVGLDKDLYLSHIAANQIAGFVRADCNNPLPFKEWSFDFVHIAHVIEHLPNPIILLSEVLRILRPKGILYLEAPSVSCAFIPPLGLKGTLNFYDDPTHIRPYTRESLRRLGLQAGFKEKDMELFTARNKVSLLFLPYLLVKFIFTGYNDYLYNILEPILGLSVAGIFVKN